MNKKKSLILFSGFVIFLGTFALFQNFVSSPKNRVVVTDYGALGDGVTDATAAIQQAIAAAVRLGPNTEIYFPAGTYRLLCSGNASSMCLAVGSANNLSFRGAGSAQTKFLIGNRLKGFLDVSNSSDISVQDFSVDYSELPFTQATVKLVSAATTAMQITIYPNYPSPSFLTAAMLSSTFGMVFDPATTHLKNNAPESFTIKSLGQMNATTWSLQLDSVSGISAGDKFVIPLRGASLFNFYRNHNLLFKKVLILASPGLVSAWVQNDGAISIDGVEIRRSQGRLLSSTADAIHMVDNSAKASIRNCYFEGMADDAINTRSTSFAVVGVVSATSLTFNHLGVKGFAVGQTLQAVDTSTQLPKGFAHITSMSKSGGNAIVTLDQPIPNIKVGDILFNADFAIPNLLVRDNVFANFRGMFRIRSRGAIFANNSILDAKNARVFISADIAPLWTEGPSLINSLDGVYFNGNYVQNGSFNLLQLNYQNVGPPSLSGDAAMKAHPLVFDPNFYRSYYPDLAYMNNNELKNHWINSGISEGRRGNAEFNASEYLNLYPDLKNGLGASNFSAATLHYLQSGFIIENRTGSLTGNSLVYDVATYRILNPDLAGMTNAQLGVHWLNHGIYEARRAHIQFSASEYLSIYADIRNGYGSSNYLGAIQHYSSVGALQELRLGTFTASPLVFNASAYGRLNPDLSNSGLDDLQLSAHWLKNGIKEGRMGNDTFNSRIYLSRYSDLAKGLGLTNYYMAIQHYVLSGKAEGRSGI